MMVRLTEINASMLAPLRTTSLEYLCTQMATEMIWALSASGSWLSGEAQSVINVSQSRRFQ